MSFRAIVETVPLYARPCDCPAGGRSLALGTRSFIRLGYLTRSDEDLEECRQCGAVWRLDDVVPRRSHPGIGGLGEQPCRRPTAGKPVEAADLHEDHPAKDGPA